MIMKKILVFILTIAYAFTSLVICNCVAASELNEQMPVIYISNSFDEKINLDITDSKGGLIEHTMVDSNGMCHFYSGAESPSSSYVDAVSPNISGVNTYIIEATVLPISIEGTSFIGLFDAKDIDGAWRLGCRFQPNGEIQLKNFATNTFEKVGQWQENTSVRMSLAYDIEAGTVDVYVNGEKTYDDMPCSNLRPFDFRIDLHNPDGSGYLEFFVDNIRAYSGTLLLSDDEFFNIDSSVMDYSAVIGEFLSNAQVYTVEAPYYFKDGTKHTYPSELHKSIYIDDPPYVSEKIVSDLMNKSISSVSNTKVINGISYISAYDAATLADKQIYCDGRGFFILSDSTWNYPDSEKFVNTFEPIDYIYRYIFFDNPSGEEILQDFYSIIQKGQHPRVLYDDDDITYIKAQNGDRWNEVKYRAKVSGNNEIDFVDTKVPLTADCDVSNKKGQAYTFQLLMERFANAYILTNDSKYADKAIECMKTLCQWTSIADKGGSELTIGHWAMGMAIGYDVFYDYMNSTEQGRQDLQTIKDAVVDIAFKDAIGLYKGLGTPTTSGVANECWINIRDNMSGVVAGGMLALVLAFADEEDIQQEIAYLLENIIRTMQLTTSLFGRDGGFFEGVSYSDYLLTNLSYSIEALWKCCGTDYRLGSAPGFSKAGNFYVYMHSTNNVFNFHDCDQEFSDSPLPYWFAYRYGQKDVAQLWYHQNNLAGNKIYDLYSMFLCDKGIGLKADSEGMPLDYCFKGIDTGTFRNSFEYDNQVFVGFHGGWNGLSHDMLDLGQFVFEADGVQWAVDMGGDDYNIPGYFTSYNVYRKRPEGENCVVINPKTDSGTYPGQNTKAKADLIMFETAPRAAMAAIDLTDAYIRDVKFYNRGYYFGDNRNTLIVQDEMQLKTTSELYWFMHTGADIKFIDSKTARLSYNGKNLIAKLYCSEKNAEFTSMEAAPLPTSPVVEGQAENDGISKLTVYIPDAEGDVQLGVKLIPESVFNVSSDITSAKISSWTIPEGEIDVAIDNVSINKANILSAHIQLPDSAVEASLYIDGKKICDVDTKTVSQMVLGGIDVSELYSGMHIAEIIALDKEGKELNANCSFEYSNCKNIFAFENSLSNYKGKLMSVGNGWYLNSENGSAISSADKFTLQATKSNESMSLAASTYMDSSFITDKAFVIECDVEFSSTDGCFIIECKGENSDYYMNELPLFDAGKIYNSDAYYSNTPYRIKFVVDPQNSECAFFVDDKFAGVFPSIKQFSDLNALKLKYTAQNIGDQVSFSDLAIKEYGTDEEVSVIFEESSSGLCAKVLSDDSDFSGKLMLASYNNNRLVYFEDYNATFSDNVKSAYIHPEAEYIIAMVWDGYSNMVPFCRPYYYRIR